MRPPLRFIFCFALFAVGPCSSSAEAQTAVGKTENVVVVAQDGSGDFNGKDDAPIRAAMESFGDSGGVILVREGTYTIRKTIRLRSNVTLRGTNQPTFGLPGPLLIEHDAPAGSRTLRLFANHGFQAGDELQLLPPGEGKEDPLTLSVDRAEPGLIHLSKELPRAFPQLSRLGYQHKMILGYGVTNVIVTDALGRTLFDRDIVVSAPDSGQVSYIRGGETRGFSCSPRCQPIGGDTTAAPTP